MMVVLFFSLNSFAQTSMERAKILKEEGDTYFNKQDYKTAIEKYVKAAEADKNYLPTYWTMGLALSRLHQHKLAAQSFAIILKEGKNLPKTYMVYQIANQLRLAKDFKLSNEGFDLALNTPPEYIDDYEAMADIYSYRGDLSSAVDYQIRAINFNKSDDDTSRYIGLSWYYSFLQQHQNAANAATRAIEITSNEPMGYTNRCRAYNDLKQYDKAIADCKKSLSLKPNHGETQYYLANSYRSKGNIAEATRWNRLAIPNLINELQAAINQETISLHDYCYILGNGLFQEKRYAEAVKIYESGLEFRPNFPLLRFNLGMAYIKVNNKRGATGQYQELSKIDYAKALTLKQRIDAMR
jgi:tetratricopeptide (TPR) repeat protein